MLLLTKLRKFPKIHNEIIQKQLQMSMIKKKTQSKIHISPEERQEIIDELKLK